MSFMMAADLQAAREKKSSHYFLFIFFFCFFIFCPYGLTKAQRGDYYHMHSTFSSMKHGQFICPDEKGLASA